jgi:hypothetical protein
MLPVTYMGTDCLNSTAVLLDMKPLNASNVLLVLKLYKLELGLPLVLGSSRYTPHTWGMSLLESQSAWVWYREVLQMTQSFLVADMPVFWTFTRRTSTGNTRLELCLIGVFESNTYSKLYVHIFLYSFNQGPLMSSMTENQGFCFVVLMFHGNSINNKMPEECNPATVQWRLQLLRSSRA